MTLKELNRLGRELCLFLSMFAGCFTSVAGRRLLKIYVQGQLSDVKSKNCEAIALKFGQPPRTLQRFLESIKWDEEQVRDRCQQIDQWAGSDPFFVFSQSREAVRKV